MFLSHNAFCNAELKEMTLALNILCQRLGVSESDVDKPRREELAKLILTLARSNDDPAAPSLFAAVLPLVHRRRLDQTFDRYVHADGGA